MISLTDTNSKRIFWNTTADSFVSMTKNGNLCTTISTTSFMANVLLKKLILTFVISFVSICNAKQLRRDGHISKNSVSGYWSTFRGFLKILYRNRLITTNINDFLDKIETEDTPKDYLSVEELYKLAETPCKKPILKTAALFSCLTSLRISDIPSLQWHEIVDFAAGGKCVHTITQKTKTEDIIPISDEALQLIGYSPEKTGATYIYFWFPRR